MEFAIGLGLGGWIVLIVGSLVFGAVAQMIGEPRAGFEWLGDAIAAGIGALVASEFIVAWRTFEPTWDGLALVPALIEALDDPAPSVRFPVTVALMEIGPAAKAAVPRLQQMVDEELNDEIAASARRALKRIDPAAVPTQ